MINLKDKILGSIYGVIVGDALGVPVEFQSKTYLKNNPISEMTGYGTYNQPPGTWSDDSSMTLCLIDMLNGEYNIHILADNFVKWRFDSQFTPFNHAFDVGNTTRSALSRYRRNKDPFKSGEKSVTSNGNGSLMRILPLLFYIKDFSDIKRIEIIRDVSSITHAHIRSVLACYFYLEFALKILNEVDKVDAFNITRSEYIKKIESNNSEFINAFFKEESENNYDILVKEFNHFTYIQNGYQFPIKFDNLVSDGYVVNTLDTAFRCILSENTFESTVLKSINNGEDTDTSGAVTGGLAGIIYGYSNIPSEWVEGLQNSELLEKYINIFTSKYSK